MSNDLDLRCNSLWHVAGEAAATDPQQRLFLACCAESLETAGYRATPALNSDNGLQIGVFCAVETSDYAYLQQDKPSPYTGTGSHTAVAPNRVSYTFDLRGPSVALNTACSSSLTCLSVAKRSFDGNECSAVLVGGANLQLTTAVVRLLRGRGHAQPVLPMQVR